MTRHIPMLGLLLCLQLIIVAVVFWPREQVAQSQAQTALQSVDPAAVDRVVISGEQQTVVLTRSGERWQLPDYHNLPADPDTLQQVLQTLPETQRGWPVAQTESARLRFEVSAERYQRKVDYYSDEQAVAGILLGTSPGFRKVHARPQGDNAVYAVEFNTFDLPMSASTWLDKDLLQIENASAINGLDYQIAREGTNWVNSSGVAADTEGANDLLSALQNLRVTGVADAATAKILSETEVGPTLTVSSGDRTLAYTLYSIESEYYVQRADIPLFFTLTSGDFEKLNGPSAASLFPEDSETDDAASEESAAPEAPAAPEEPAAPQASATSADADQTD